MSVDDIESPGTSRSDCRCEPDCRCLLRRKGMFMCGNHRIVVVAFALCGWIAMAGVGFAGFIGVDDGNTVTATAGSHFPDPNHDAANLTNGSGMTPNNPVTMASTTWNDAGGNGMWVSASAPAEASKWVLFTFANNTSLAEMVVWNYNQSQSNLWLRGLKGVTNTYSTGSDATGLGNSLFSGDLACATGIASQTYTDRLIFANGVFDVKAVRIAYTTNWGSGTGDFAYYGLSEVRFARVPEPSAAVLLATGLFGLAACAWRRRPAKQTWAKGP
jgi:hypothetical protein